MLRITDRNYSCCQFVQQQQRYVYKYVVEMDVSQWHSVQNKLSCVFETAVLSEPSEKRSYQPYKVVATGKLRQEALDHEILKGHPSEKLDGTCVLISPFQGKPWLWARHDRKPTKRAEKKFKAFQNNINKGEKKEISAVTYPWDVSKDLRDVPDNWTPASGVVVEGQAQPSPNGHIPGWIPLDHENRQHCWHLSAVHLEKGLALILREDTNHNLEIVAVPLNDLEGHTAELIGTNINANPYKMGSKQCPVHLLVVHGSIRLTDPPRVEMDEISVWFTKSPSARVEGIVWHCLGQTLFKLHRNHIGQPWPIDKPLLSERPVKMAVKVNRCDLCQLNDSKHRQKDLFCLLGRFPETKCDSLSALNDMLSLIMESTEEKRLIMCH